MVIKYTLWNDSKISEPEEKIYRVLIEESKRGRSYRPLGRISANSLKDLVGKLAADDYILNSDGFDLVTTKTAPVIDSGIISNPLDSVQLCKFYDLFRKRSFETMVIMSP